MAAAVEKRVYKNPPLIEAVAEFRFDPSGGWDSASPGLIYEILRDELPSREQVAAVDAETVETDDGNRAQRIRPVERLQLQRKDQTAAATLSPHYLGISRLAPYESWVEFKPLIERSLAAYREVVEPETVSRIGLRYVNRIEFDGPDVEISKFFNYYPHVGEGLPTRIGPFICGIQIEYEDARDTARLQIAEAPAPDDVSAFSLDIDYFLAQAGAVTLDEVAAWLETAHDTVEELFEACITDDLRARLDA